MIENKKLLRTCVLVVAGLFAGFLGKTAQAGTVYVGTCVSHVISYPSISAAISGAPAGTTIKICPGVYYEQLLITQPMTLIGIQSGTADEVVVMPPAAGLVVNMTSASGTLYAAQIGVNGATDVNISNLTVDGANNLLPDCSAFYGGIVYLNASGTVNHVVVQNMFEPPVPTCFNGAGVGVSTDPALTSTVTVENSSIHNLQTDGLSAVNPGTTVTFSNNALANTGVTLGFVQNGIEIDRGATGTATGNSIADFNLTNGIYTSTGILVGFPPILGSPTNIKVTNNSVSDTTGAIASAGGEGDVISSNKIYSSLTGTGVSGIYICSNSDTVNANTLSFSNPAGVFLDNSCGSTTTGSVVSDNTMNEGCAGIMVASGVTGNTFSHNTFYNVGSTQISGSTCTSALPSVSRLSTKHTKPMPMPERP